jgi:hypothetical protein
VQQWRNRHSRGEFIATALLEVPQCWFECCRGSRSGMAIALNLANIYFYFLHSFSVTMIEPDLVARIGGNGHFLQQTLGFVEILIRDGCTGAREGRGHNMRR